MVFLDKNNSEINISNHFWFTAITLFAIVAIILLQQPLLLAGLFLVSIFFVILGITEFKFKDYQLLAILFCIIIVLPPLSTKGSLRVLRPEVFFFLTVFPFLIFNRTNLSIHKSEKLVRYFIYSLIAFSIYILFSIFYARYYLETPIAAGDFLEIFKYIMFIVIILAVRKLELEKNNIQWLLYTITGFFFLATILGLMMFYGVLGTDQLLGPVYFFERLHDVNVRVMGTFFNPNTFGTALTIASVVSLGLFLHSKTLKKKSLFLFSLAVFAFCVFLTQSRTAVITLALAYVVFAIVHTFSGNLSLKQMFITLGVFALLMAAILNILADVFIDRLLSITNIMEDPSWQMRLTAWYFNLHVFTESMLFGLGPAKAVYTGTVDNEYILILRRYGIIGLLIHSFIYLLPVYRSVLFFKKKGTPLLMAQIVFVSSAVLLVSNITSQPFHEIQLMNYWFLFLGIFFNLPINEDALILKK